MGRIIRTEDNADEFEDQPGETAQQLDLDGLERRAKAATPGPWFPDYPFVSHDKKRPRAGRVAEVSVSHKSSATFEANTLYLAAANPATVLRLITAARSAAALDVARESVLDLVTDAVIAVSQGSETQEIACEKATDAILAALRQIGGA